jgi:hypothetical protein
VAVAPRVEVREVRRDPRLHGSSSGTPFGQNQPISATAMGSDP